MIHTEELLLQNQPAVLSLFQSNPSLPEGPPRFIRVVNWQYWFTDLAVKHREGLWWRREDRGLYGPALERKPDGSIIVLPIRSQLR